MDLRLLSLFLCPDDGVQGFPLHEGGRKPERAERARESEGIWRESEGASVGIGWGIGGNGGLPSERSERGSVYLRTRMRARVPRRRVRAIPLYIGVLGGFVVCFSV